MIKREFVSNQESEQERERGGVPERKKERKCMLERVLSERSREIGCECVEKGLTRRIRECQ